MQTSPKVTLLTVRLIRGMRGVDGTHNIPPLRGGNEARNRNAAAEDRHACLLRHAQHSVWITLELFRRDVHRGYRRRCHLRSSMKLNRMKPHCRSSVATLASRRE